MRTFSSLVGRSVETQSGLSLGSVQDLRAELSGSRLDVVALCVGRAGWLDRLGVRTKAHDEVAWSSVLRVEGDRIVVRDP